MIKNIFWLLPLAMAISCADEQMVPHLAAEKDVGDILIIPHKSKPVTVNEEERKPYYASLPYYCDPNLYEPNIVLSAKACKPFLASYFRQGYAPNISRFYYGR